MGFCIRFQSVSLMHYTMKLFTQSWTHKSKTFAKSIQVGGLTRTRKREPTRGVRGHAPPGKFEILFF